jgi:hypothetical protein
MITDTGKQIIGKYLVGQTDSYASYLAIGSGPKPLASATAFGDYSTKTSLDFETLRVPIVSRNVLTDKNTAKITAYNSSTGVVTASNYFVIGQKVSIVDSGAAGIDGAYTIINSTDTTFTITSGIGTTASNLNGTATVDIVKITLTAELPTEERYEITEIGIYPSQNNPIPTGLDSQSLILFDSNELWESHVSSTVVPVPLQLGTIFNSNNDINIADKVFYANSNNALFENINYPNRLARHERPRFLDRAIFVRGDSAVLATSGTDLTVTSGDHIHLTIDPVNLSKNSPDDELRLAFTVINKNGIGSTHVPSNVKILVQFADTDGASPQYASFVVNLDNGTSTGQWDFATNRYVVVKKKISELFKTGTFSWDKANTIKVYVSVTGTSPATAGDFYVALDAIRLENVSSFSNVYGLTAYTVMKTSDSLPIVKSDNTSSFIEFSYVMDVL